MVSVQNSMQRVLQDDKDVKYQCCKNNILNAMNISCFNIIYFSIMHNSNILHALIPYQNDMEPAGK